MPLELEVQFDIVIYALTAGLFLGVFFDIYRLIRGKDGHKIIIIIEDVLFWIFCALSVFMFLLYTNYAFLGPYVYLCMGVSLFIYIKLFSNTILSIEKFLINGLISFIRIGYKSITYPFREFWAKINNKQ